MPDEFGRRIKYLMEHVSNMDKAKLSVHCHNDLGMAMALSLAGVENGAGQIECTINGLGERAGYCHGRSGHGYQDPRQGAQRPYRHLNGEFVRASRLVSSITGFIVQRNKANCWR